VLRAVLGEEVASRDLAEPGIYSMVEVLAPTMISYARPSLAAEMAGGAGGGPPLPAGPRRDRVHR
jgi:hypothetical protein